MKLSILDQVPMSRGETPVDAIQHTIELVQMAERIGYDRYFVAEHHNTTGLISHAPEILMTRLLSVTNTIKIGSAGILLTQYSPYKIAENANLLEAMFPGRVTIGLGNSPGGNELTRSALMDGTGSKVHEYDRLLQDFLGFMRNTLPLTHKYRGVKAGPRINHHPDIFTLTLTDNGARRAARLGIGMVFGNFISNRYVDSALQIYQNEFQPNQYMSKPYTIFCIFIVVAKDEEEKAMQKRILDHWLLNVSKGRDTVVPSDIQVQKYAYSDKDLKIIEGNQSRYILGLKDEVAQALQILFKQYQFDELMVINNTYDFELKKQSFEAIKAIIDHINKK
ncbi:LLM class flavin-dependent oxidoreductase [Macrococcoides caseolyticum]|uniref:LLM class flavin-dependent oxidoreductase n=1 Tax=Macrococcoides caseolyticum TaxID=69966 RepID=UPI001F16B862|nr:LLM class flavin-dependent oxidoreductase [Macrococcus caseolyticus]MCE4957040.1 LLM class flavin-dependent oxidoreductase [Macrococcus caseolyticus]